MADHDIIVYGATGYTGRLVAEHMLKAYGAAGDLSWAMAGRSGAKLAEVRGLIGAPDSLPLVVADAADPASLAAMAHAAKAIITTVGPYQLYGDGLVAACADAGTDYVDLTGESHWIAAMIAANEAKAKASGARIVFSCGFNSIPFDLGVFFLEEEAKKRFGGPVARVRGRVRGLKGGLSGGTLASGMATMAAVQKDASLGAVMADPFALTPGFKGPKQPDGETAYEDKVTGSWVAPFMMAGINTKAVHRSNFLLGHPWGTDFVRRDADGRRASGRRTAADRLQLRRWSDAAAGRGAEQGRARGRELRHPLRRRDEGTGGPSAAPSRATWTPATARPRRSWPRAPSAWCAMCRGQSRRAAAGPAPRRWASPWSPGCRRTPG